MNFNNTSGKYNINKIRFFANTPDSTMVAIFGQPSSYDDGWIANLNIEEIFAIPPNEFDLDRLYDINEFLTDAEFSKSFSSRPAETTTNISAQKFAIQVGDVIEQSDFSSQPLVFFPHIPKTGGQALHDGFFKVFGQKKCLRIWDPRFGADVAPSLYAQVDKQRFANISAVIGHLTMAQFNENKYCNSLLKDGRVRVFASVRNPIDRIISLYNYIKNSPHHPNHFRTMKLSLSEFALLEPANFQYHYLALHSSESIHSIQSRIEIYPTEDSRQGLEYFLWRHFNTKLSDLENRNESQALSKYESLEASSIDVMSQDTIRHLQTIHHLDIELYHACLQSARAL